MGEGIIVRTGVSSCSSEENIFITRSADRIIKGLAEATSTPAVAHDVSTILTSVVDTFNRISSHPEAEWTEELTSHYLYIPCHSSDTDTVVANSTHCAGTVGAMTLLIHGISVIIEGIDSMYIVNPTIVVIIDSVAGNFTAIHPHVVD